MNKIMWWRLGALLLIALIQVSFVNILFPKSAIPMIILNTIMAVVLVRGFRTGLGEWLSLLLFFDILRSSTITALVPYGIFVAYLTSFVSRRFIFEHRGSGTILLASLAVLSGIFYLVSNAWIEAYTLTVSSIIFDSLFIFLSFFPIFLLVQWFEDRLDKVSHAEFRGLRKTS